MLNHCCQIGCEKEAEWEIYHDSNTIDTGLTCACTKHVGELLSDALEHRIFHIVQPVVR